MSLEQKDLYYVAVKVFFEKDGKLFIFRDKWNDWDLPGGRIRKDEFYAPIEETIRRKMSEELGNEITYEIGGPVVFMKHERQEATAEKQTVRIFAIGFEGKLLSGEPKMGDHHIEMKWVDVATFKPEEYFTGGWLKGVQEYLAKKR